MLSIEQAFTLCITVAVCICVLHPFRFPLSGGRRKAFEINHVTAAVAGVLVLHFFDVIDLWFMWTSLMHSGRVQPWAVLVIFFTLAYASISLDVTGFSKFVALKILGTYSSKDSTARPNVPRLLVVVYFLSGLIALVASNDVVVLTLTPVLIHYCELVRVDPRPVLLVEYISANTFSAYLLVGNPTNIIVGQGTSMKFAEYLMLLAFPTTVTVVSSAAAIYWLSSLNPLLGVSDKHEPIDATMKCEDTARLEDIEDGTAASLAPEESVDLLQNPEKALLDAKGAMVGGAVLGSCVVLLILCGYTPLPMYAVTLGTAIILFAHDLTLKRTDADATRTDEGEGEIGGCARLLQWFLATSRAGQVFRRMPWDVAPFAISMFIIVNILSKVNLTPALTESLVTLEKLTGSLGCSVFGTFGTIVAMNILNNQPATILLVSVLLGQDGIATSDRMSFSCLVVSLIFGSNVAAGFAPKGALAGIMWESIMTHHNIVVSWRDFVSTGAKVLTIPCLLGATAIYLQSFVLTVKV